jgi:flagellar assembly factor FliW
MHREIVFPAGIPAFPGRRTFSVEEVHGVPLARLTAKEDGGPTFLVLTAPALYFPDLGPFDLDDATAGLIGATQSSDIVSWLIVTPRWAGPTANLLGPVVVNLGKGLAAQVVRKDLTLPVAAPLPSLEEPHA